MWNDFYMMQAVGEIVRKQEQEYTRGTTTISKYVSFSMYETLSRIDAYLNSKHISGETDSKGRPKPFLNIVVAAANIWFRATDVDRRHIKLWSKNRKGWINSFFANILLQDWMKREGFGQTLNEWGRVLSRYGSAMLKFVKNSSGLHVSVVSWSRLIVDSVDADAAPKIEVLELSESQLRERIKTNGYDKEQVEALIQAKRTRETLDNRKKDTKADYYKLYEVHGNMPLSLLGEDTEDYGWQMHVISFVGGKKKGDKEYQDFTVYKGREDGDPFMLTHLIKEDGRTLAIGPVEYLFDAQWMQNHSTKSIKDQLDIASKMLLQTADPQFLGRNIVDQLEHGDVLIHMPNQPLTQVHNASHDIVSWQNYAVQFREVGRELTGISETMLGAQPKAGTAWRLQEALLNESYSLFELMTENKGLDIEKILRERILPYLFSKYDDEEVAAVLEKNDLEKLDRLFIRHEAAERVNEKVFQNLEALARGEDVQPISPGDQEALIAEEEQNLQLQLQEFTNQRFIKPSEVSWKKQFKDVEWDVEIDVTPEAHNMQEMMTTLNTALRLVTAPGFDQNPKAQAIVGRLLEISNAMSPVEYYSLPPAVSQTPAASVGAGQAEPQEPQRNIK
jgi:hypothetical protein